MDLTDIEATLRQLEADSGLRRIPEADETSGRLDLLSNDYMGLAAQSSHFRERFLKRFPDVAFSSSASRLLARRQKEAVMLEQYLGSLYGRPALLFNSGYHANTGLIQALSRLPSTLFIADKLIHASSIDGLRLAGTPFKRFRHNDLEHLERILMAEQGKWRHIFVAVESVYSMDGDMADLPALVALKRRFPALALIVDEAHGFGTRGERGLGLCEETSTLGDIDIIVGTLGKAAASAGAFVVAARPVVDYLVNTARSFIFSTALPPAQHAWSLMMVEELTKMRDERLHLARISSNFAKYLERITGVATGSRSQIVPLMAGSAARAVALAGGLREAGFDCLPIRHPTVAAGTERVRISLNALLTADDIRRLGAAVEALVSRL